MVLNRLEAKLGLLSLKEVRGIIDKFPDAPRLRLIRDIMLVAERLSKNSTQLDTTIRLVELIKDTPQEKIEAVHNILKKAEALAKLMPADLPERLASFLKED